MHTASRPELTTGLLTGIFVGGRSRRMLGVPKGLLPSPEAGLNLVERLIRSLHELGAGEVLLVGEAGAYAALGLPNIADEQPGIGPIGGLLALLEHAAATDRAHVLALACDLPYVTRDLLAALIERAPGSAAVVPRASGVLQPLCAVYAAALCLPRLRARVLSGERALFRFVDSLGTQASVVELDAEAAALLRDWDTPEDVER